MNASITIRTLNVNLGRSPGPLGAALAAALFASAPVPAAAASPREARTASEAARAVPRIGELWPGQGGIYVGMGRGYDGGADYHLILPTAAGAIFSDRTIGTYGIDVAGANSDHDGMANTKALAAAGSELCKEILALEIDGHKDFYLMSRTDARLCIANVPEQFEKTWYLTSTQASAFNAWNQYFNYGFQYYVDKKFEARARAVRRLIL